jgi:hypothetical protein
VRQSRARAPSVDEPEDGIRIPTLRLDLLKNYTPGPILPNTRRPLRLETDLFDGYMLFLIRTDPLDPNYRHMFEGKQRKFNVQVQGRFKVPVRNPYFGGEITSKMELGLLAKGTTDTNIMYLIVSP